MLLLPVASQLPAFMACCPATHPHPPCPRLLRAVAAQRHRPSPVFLNLSSCMDTAPQLHLLRGRLRCAAAAAPLLWPLAPARPPRCGASNTRAGCSLHRTCSPHMGAASFPPVHNHQPGWGPNVGGAPILDPIFTPAFCPHSSCLQGQLDYQYLKGDTGPLVYPAGFVYLFSFLRNITGEAILPAQVCGLCSPPCSLGVGCDGSLGFRCTGKYSTSAPSDLPSGLAAWGACATSKASPP